jgi:GT2 family glycosyltransferase
MGSSPLVLFITDDVFVQPGFLRCAVDTMITRKDVGVMGFKLLFPTTSTDPQRPAGKVQHIGHAFTLKGEVVHPLVGWSADNPRCCVSRELLSVTGAVMMFRRDVFNRVRGFDEVYGRGTYEDVDICMKIRQAGHKVFLNADAVAHHFTGATAAQLRIPFPLNENRQEFNQRWLKSGLVQWDEWSFW